MALAALGCGRTERAPGDTSAIAGSTSSSNGGTGGVGPAAAAGGGAAGADAMDDDPLVLPYKVAGRWALFVFDDPVGVQLMQQGSELSGEGCAAGTPPLQDSFAVDYCGPIHGSVSGHRVQFSFTFESGGVYTYAADVTVSSNGERMAGSFHGVGDVSWSTAWVRVADGEQGLPRPAMTEPDPLWGQYELSLMGSSAGATEYQRDKVYLFSFLRDGFASDLGSFWYTEWAYSPEDYSFDVGPVPDTLPNLATSLGVEANPVDGITWVQANTASGNSYGFAATRKNP